MKFALALLFTLGLVVKTSAFALLGPFESWQTQTLGYNVFNESIGGSKNVGEEYRWNVPVITYGFDPSFEEYFGKPGIAAVQSAFEILNNLPPASEITITNYPVVAFGQNVRGLAGGLIDLKTVVLSKLLEILGLSDPEENVWSLRERTVSLSETNYYVIQRNFDPVTGSPSKFVNGTRFTYQIVEFRHYDYNYFYGAAAIENTSDPYDAYSLAGFGSRSLLLFTQWPPVGLYFDSLSQDDIGGLRYLLHPSNINYERHRYDQVHALDGSSSSFVNAALRPGVDKINFEQVTNWYGNVGWSESVEFNDNYYLNGVLYTQRLVRTITKPDIIFSAQDIGMLFGTQPRLVTSSVPAWDSPARDSGGAAGPGTISGPITLTFNTLLGGLASSFPGQTTEENSGYFAFWATFDGSALPPIEYPYTSFSEVASESFITKTSNTPNTITLQFRSFPNIQFIVESSPDLVHWSEIKRVSTSALTNTESFSVEMTDNKSGFFRFRPERP